VPLVLNPQDSATATAYAVDVQKANTQAGAILRSAELPGGTFAPILVHGERWFRVLGGAFATRAGADSLLAALRTQRVLEPLDGTTVRVPLAFLVDTVGAAAAPEYLRSLAQRQLPVYGLRQDDGRVVVYAGAFESPEQSVLLIEPLRAARIEPRLVYRQGRMF
jgi:hypothetical protein